MEGMKRAIFATALCGALCCCSPGGNVLLDGDADLEEEAPADGPGDDWTCGASALRIDKVVFGDTVPEMTSFEVVVGHQMAAAVEAAVTVEGSLVEVQVTGYDFFSCLCNDGMWCGPPDAAPVTLSRFRVPGLAPGYYTFRINGANRELKVVDDSCPSFTPSVTGAEYTEHVRRGSNPVRLVVASEGHSCSCNGKVFEAHTLAAPPALEARVTLEEIVCNPESCCDTCACRDAYSTEVYLWVPDVAGTYNVLVNGRTFPLYVD